eukprot:103943-Hanusia_phi.AAC.1
MIVSLNPVLSEAIPLGGAESPAIIIRLTGGGTTRDRTVPYGTGPATVPGTVPYYGTVPYPSVLGPNFERHRRPAATESC